MRNWEFAFIPVLDSSFRLLNSEGVGEPEGLAWTTEVVVMRNRGKKFTAARAQVPADRTYTIEEAVPLMQKVKFAKFDETVELALRLGVDPKHADQMVRGTVVLPHGLGKSKKVLAIAGADKRSEERRVGKRVDHGGRRIIIKKKT